MSIQTFVPDNSVVMARVLGEEDPGADRVMDRLADGAAPAPGIWPPEFANSLVVAERRKRLSEAEAVRAREVALALPIRIVREAPDRILSMLRTILPLVLLAVSCHTKGNGGPGDTTLPDVPVADLTALPCPAGPAVQRTNVPYAAAPAGTDPNLLSLDLYAPAGDGTCMPVVVWVHGGAWHGGDKKNNLADKIALFNGAGWAFASVNYRLSPATGDPANPDPDRVMYPVHEQDVAAAVAWVRGHAGEFGADPERIALVGHSAGAGIVALLGTDESFLAAHGLGLDAVRAVASFDTESYDIPRTLQTASATQRLMYLNAFGDDPSTLVAASPVTHVAAGKGIPPFLLAERGAEDRRAILRAFRAALEGAGVPVGVIDASGLTHEEVSDRIGQAGDTVVTPALMTFLGNFLGDPH
ncbi:MAG: alpha/beta hydrolase fold domain-containing protein [Deltaproteobacteria bacterium]|nr:alpha/beta hydrolase fold domain-containing protein [Deltaproteobacteria bacterium]